MPTSTPSALSDILSAITALDSTLDMCRVMLEDARDDETRRKVRSQINGILDQRLILMKRRDALSTQKAA